MCSCDDGESPRVFERRLAKAHASRSGALHWCCECRRDIALDEWHEDASGLWSGTWDRFKTCLRCVARREAWAQLECRPAFTQLHETIRECLVTHDYDRGIGRMRHRIDRSLGREYLRGLRSARESVRSALAQLEAQRRERRRASNMARWSKPAPTHLGEGI